MSADSRFMKRALELAIKGRGKTSPNPLVGAVLVKENRIIGEGYHRAFGEPHAEIEALQSSTESVENADLYVNLEPCSVQGKTPPCVDAIIRAGIKRVVIGIVDPNPDVNGNGIKILKEHGVKVKTGICREEAESVNRGFISLMKQSRPFITLKLAATMDGYIADMQGKSQWITSGESLHWVHDKRAEYDAIMIGFSTAFKDNPHLTTRGKRETEPFRIVVDESLSIPFHLNLISDKNHDRTIILTTEKASEKKEKRLKDAGIRVIRTKSDEGGWVDLAAGMRDLGKNGITSVFVEGGSLIAGSLIRQKLVDDIYLFIAPRVIGKGVSLFSGFSLSLDASMQFKWKNVRMTGADCLLHGAPSGG